jgi:sulfate permease, SulP family
VNKEFLILLRGDITGAITAGFVSLPGNIAFGLIAYAPLGEAYVGTGILAGMFSSIFAGLFATIFGKTRIMLSGPQAPTALIFASVIGQLLASGMLDPASQMDAAVLLSIVSLVVLLSGVFQVLFALFRFGTFIKFISYPVVAGIINATAILIIKGQIGPMLGIDLKGSENLTSILAQISTPTLCVSAVTIALMFVAKRIIAKIPASLVSIVGGTALFYLLKAVGLGDKLGAVIGALPSTTPSISNALLFVQIAADSSLWTFAPMVLSAAFSIAVIGSIHSLLSAVALQRVTQRRPDGNAELRAQGIGNIIGACFGAIPSAGYIGRSMVNYEAGGRTKRSGIFSSLAILVLMMFLVGAIGYIPRAVMASVVLAIGISIVDRWSVELIRKLFQREMAAAGELLFNLAIMLLVVLVTLFFSLITAVVVGVIASILVFIRQMNRAFIRRIYRGSQCQSKRQRFAKSAEWLKEHREQIAVIELEGAIFFGSADKLAQEIDKLIAEGTRSIILDMKRINQIDSSGAKVLEQMSLQLRKQHIDLAVSYLDDASPIWSLISDLGLMAALGSESFFADTSLAVEYFEDVMLERTEDLQIPHALSLEQFLVSRGMVSEDVAVIEPFVKEEDYGAGQSIIRLGENTREMYLLVQGSADVLIPLEGGRRRKRVQTLSAGASFGEMALLDSEPRAADVVAREDLTCFSLGVEGFDHLKGTHPEVAMRFCVAIARILSTRLRETNEIISELEA